MIVHAFYVVVCQVLILLSTVVQNISRGESETVLSASLK